MSSGSELQAWAERVERRLERLEDRDGLHRRLGPTPEQRLGSREEHEAHDARLRKLMVSSQRFGKTKAQNEGLKHAASGGVIVGEHRRALVVCDDCAKELDRSPVPLDRRPGDPVVIARWDRASAEQWETVVQIAREHALGAGHVCRVESQYVYTFTPPRVKQEGV